MPHFRVSVSSSQADDIAVACSLGAERLRAIVNAVADAPLTIRQDRLEERISRRLDPKGAEAIARLVLGLSSVSSRDVSRIPDILDGITYTIETKYPGDKRFQKWAECKVELANLLQTDSVHLTAKALDIAYDFERILASSRVITSVRPVFDKERSKILGSTVVQTLRIEHITGQGEQNSISFALDIADVVNLRDACNDALKKATVAKRKVESGWAVEAVVAGEKSDE